MAGEAELANVGQAIAGIFIGIGSLLVCAMISAMLYQVVRYIKANADKEWKYELFEEMVLEKVAEDRGFDLKKAGIEREIIAKKGFRRRIQEELVKKMTTTKEDKK